MLAALITGLALAADSSPVQVSDPAMAMLSFLGAAPAFADERMAYHFGLGPPTLVRDRTEVFAALPDGPGPVTSRPWVISPHLVLTGRFATSNAAVELALPRTDDAGDAALKHAFSVKIQYHSGVNLLFFLPEQTPVALGAGVMVATSIGPLLSLQHPDGSEARFGRLGQVHLAPSLSAAWLSKWFSLNAVAGYAPAGPPWTFVDATLGEADGRYATADPADPQSVEEAEAALGRVRSRGATYASAGAALNLYRATEPFMTVGARVQVRDQPWRVEPGAYGHADGYRDRDVRVLVGIGIGVPRPADGG